jgi:hypothetical protein
MKSIAAFLLFSVATVCMYAQAKSGTDWTRLESDSKDFSIAVPGKYSVVPGMKDKYVSSNELGGPESVKFVMMDVLPTITAYQDGATFLVQGYHTKKLKEALVVFIQSRSQTPKTIPVSLDEFQGIVTETETSSQYSVDLVVGSNENIYRILVAARNKDNQLLRYFLSSLKLYGKVHFPIENTLSGKIKETVQPLGQLKPTAFEAEKYKGSTPGAEEFITGSGGNAEGGLGVLIVNRPRPFYTEEAFRWKIYDKVLLYVTFGAEGEVEKIRIIRELPMGLTDSAVIAARQLRFLPQEVDNKRVSVEKVVQYDFSPWFGR